MQPFDVKVTIALLALSRIITPATVFLFALLLSSNTCANTDQTWLKQYADDIKTLAKKDNVPGFAFVVVANDEPAFIDTYGLVEKKGAKIDKNTVFRLASVSKTFTAALISKQNAEQTLDWQIPLAKLAPEYKIDNYSDKPILLRHLVGQSTGFTPNAYDNLIEANYKLPRVLKHLEKLDSLCKPGYCYTYQNTLFGVLEHYYQAIDSSFEEALLMNIIAPLQMPHASVGKQGLINSETWAKPHVAIDKRKWVKVRVKDNYYRFGPAAGVNASAADMEIWLRAMLHQYPEVINEQMIKELTHPRVKTIRELRRRNWREHLQAAHYGLGWRIYNFDGITINYHGGWVQGYRADVSFSPELGVGYVMLMNAESNLINQTTAEFWKRQIAQHKLASK